MQLLRPIVHTLRHSDGLWHSACRAAAKGDPGPIVQAIFSKSRGMFQRGEQHDLSELWLFVTTALYEEGPHKPHLPIGKLRESPFQKAAFDSINAHFPKGACELLLAITGQLITQIHCQKCGYMCHNHEPFTILSIEPEEHLEKGIAEFLNPEKITNWKCDRCGKFDAEKVTRFWSLPRFLCISLKRFEYQAGRMKKKTSPVTIPARIRFSSDIVLSANSSQDYTISAIGLHHGFSGHGGHYTAVVRQAAQKWYHIDDENIRPLEESTIRDFLRENSRSYLILYELQAPLQAPRA